MLSAARARMPMSASICDLRAGGACTGAGAGFTASTDGSGAADVAGLSAVEAGSVVDTQAPRGTDQSCPWMIRDGRRTHPVKSCSWQGWGAERQSGAAVRSVHTE